MSNPFEFLDRLQRVAPDHVLLEQEGESISVSPRGDPVCDFCSGGPVTHDVRAPNFQMPTSGHWSRGDWAACTPCATLVESGDWAGLVDRVAATFDVPPRPYLVEIYRRLRECMTGVRKIS